MNKIMYRLASLALCLGLMASCDDSVSELGESIQSPEDKVASDIRYLQFEAKTVSAPSLYTGASTTSLVGEIADPVYGDFRAGYVAQLRTAPEWTLSSTPIDGSIDSTVLALDIRNYVGSATARLNLGIYTAPLGYSVQKQSVTNLDDIKASSTLVGEKFYSIEKDVNWYYNSASDSVLRMSINLGKDLGQRIYELSKSNPEYFLTQDAFNRNVLGGLLVATTTGRGSVMQIVGTTLQIHYRYQQGDSVQRARASFISSRTTGHTNALSTSYIESLLEESDSYTYIKQPAGVVTQITLPREQMNRLMQGVGQVKIGANWTLADTQLRVDVDNPSDLLLNPPTYMLLLPPDSISSFFQTEQTERTQAVTSYLSTPYTVDNRYYNFANIARVITAHLAQHATYSSGAWTVSKDLELYMIPVQRTVSSSNSSGTVTTTALSEYLFPSFVRLSKQADKLRIGVISSKFSQ